MSQILHEHSTKENVPNPQVHSRHKFNTTLFLRYCYTPPRLLSTTPIRLLLELLLFYFILFTIYLFIEMVQIILSISASQQKKHQKKNKTHQSKK